MKVVFLGAGNAATVLARKIKLAGHEIIQVYSRHLYNAEELADEIDCAAADEYQNITREGQLYIIALTDTALNHLHANWQANDKLVVHTAGSVSMHALQNVSSNYGVLYPLQSLRKERNYYDNFPILTDANTSDSLAMINYFAATISQEVKHASDDERMHLHVAAVIVNNFTNHLYTLAEKYCAGNGVSFSLLKPLIMETAERMEEFAPEYVQTGPALRHDSLTIEKHRGLLQSYPQLLELYQQFTKSIQAGDL